MFEQRPTSRDPGLVERLLGSARRAIRRRSRISPHHRRRAGRAESRPVHIPRRGAFRRGRAWRGSSRWPRRGSAMASAWTWLERPAPLQLAWQLLAGNRRSARVTFPPLLPSLLYRVLRHGTSNHEGNFRATFQGGSRGFGGDANLSRTAESRTVGPSESHGVPPSTSPAPRWQRGGRRFEPV